MPQIPQPMDYAQWREQCPGVARHGTPDRVWDCYRQGVDWLLQLLAAGGGAGMHDLLVGIQELLGGGLLPLAQSGQAWLEARLEQELGDIERAYRRLEGRSGDPHEVVESRLYALVVRLWAMEPLLAALNRTPWSLHQEILAHLQLLETELGRTPEEAGSEFGAEGMQQLRLVRVDLLGRQLQVFRRGLEGTLRSGPLPGEAGAEDAAALMVRLRYGERLLLDLLGEALLCDGHSPYAAFLDRTDAPPAPPPASTTEPDPEAQPQPAAGSSQRLGDLRALDTTLDALYERVLEMVRRLPPEQARQWLAAQGVAVADVAADTVADAADRPLPLRAFSLRRAYGYVSRFRRGLVDPIAGEGGEDAKADYRRLRRQERLLRSEWVESTVSWRLAHRFGPRFEARLDLGVLVLVMVAIGILTVDLTADLSKEASHRLVLLDTGICALLMGDFLLRLGLAPDRADFFRRHWFTDLLPSIPFSGVALWIEAITVEAESVTVLRVLRVVGVTLRKVRPLVKLVRILLFAARGMDRLVRRYRHLLDWDIVFFEPEQGSGKVPLKERAERLRRRVQTRRRRLLEQLPLAARVAEWERSLGFLRGLVRVADRDYGRTEALVEALDQHQPALQGRRIPIEKVVDRLTNADTEEIVETLGGDFAQRMARLSWVAMWPPLRWLPVFSDILGARREAATEAEFGERLARRLGARLRWLNDRILFLADMHGIITAPQLIDRIGIALVNAMRRPRNRLLMLGVGFIVVTLLVEVLPFHWLEAAAVWLRRTLGWPILLLGGIAFVAVWVGTKLSEMAQTDTDFHIRVAEAKSINLLNEVKLAHADHDQAILRRRVLLPEARIRGVEQDLHVGDGDLAGSRVSDRFRTMVRRVFGMGEGETIAGSLAERVFLLYRDYLREAPFDRRNTNTTDHLLGNPSVWNIRYRILRLDPRQQQEIEALDLRRNSGISGPSLWLRFVTMSITQRIGQLVEEYNRHVIPLADRRAGIREHQELVRFRYWLADKHGGAVPGAHEVEGEAEVEAEGRDTAIQAEGDSHYATTIFTALDFLSNDPHRDEAIARRFGDDIAALVEADRRRLIREVFGNPPLHQRPTRVRSFNPYNLYIQTMAEGKVFLLPLTLLRQLGRAIRMGWRWLLATIDELRHPERRYAEPRVEALSEFRIAVRKIHRMRKPVFLASTRLRAQFDPEYLGLFLPGEDGNSLDGCSVADDLDMIEASPREREYFSGLRDRRRQALEELSAFLDRLGLLGGGLEEYLAPLYPDEPGHRRCEVLRAVSIAYVTNFNDLRDLVQGPDRLAAAYRACIAAKGRKEVREIEQDTRRKGRGWLERVRALTRRRERRARRQRFEAWWKGQGLYLAPSGLPVARAKSYLLRWWAKDTRGIAHLIDLEVETGFEPHKAAEGRIHNVIRNVSTWTEQLVTLRGVHTLTILDIESSKHIVRNIGGYEDPRAEVVPVRVRTL